MAKATRKRGAVKRRRVWRIFDTQRTALNLWNGRLGEWRRTDGGPRGKVARRAARRG